MPYRGRRDQLRRRLLALGQGDDVNRHLHAGGQAHALFLAAVTAHLDDHRIAFRWLCALALQREQARFIKTNFDEGRVEALLDPQHTAEIDTARQAALSRLFHDGLDQAIVRPAIEFGALGMEAEEDLFAHLAHDLKPRPVSIA